MCRSVYNPTCTPEPGDTGQDTPVNIRTSLLVWARVCVLGGHLRTRVVCLQALKSASVYALEAVCLDNVTG